MSDCFEFMDIPGLNESDDFYFKEIIPILVNKCIFSIYIFDIEKYVNDDTILIYNKYSEQLNKIYNKNSIYILNKIDLAKEDEENQFVKFKDFLKNEFNVVLENNIFLKLNSNELFNEINAFTDLKFYILQIIDKLKNIEELDDDFSFIDYLKKKFVEDLQLTKEEIDNIFNEEDEHFTNYFSKEEFDEIDKIITSKNLTNDIDEASFNRFKFFFEKKKKKKLIYLH